MPLPWMASGPAPAADPEDAQLAARLAQGDETALTLIVRRWQAPLERYLARLCGRCQGGRDDILQEVFVRVYRHIHLYDRSLPFSAWIYRICRNEAVSHFRRHRRDDSIALPEDVEESLWGTLAPLPDAPLLDRETGRAIHDIVARMPEKLRDVFVLRFFEEKEYAEIGDILRENMSTVATRIRRAREFFTVEADRRGLRSWGPSPGHDEPTSAKEHGR